MRESEPDWAKVLEEFYESHGRLVLPEGDLFGKVREKDRVLFSEDENLLSQVDELDGRAIRVGVEYLIQTGLLVVDTDDTEELNQASEGTIFRSLQLTKSGFDVAHERELRNRQQDLMERQNKASRTLATFTVILGATAVVQAAAAVVSTTYPTNAFLGVLYIGVIVALWLSRDHWLMFAEE